MIARAHFRLNLEVSAGFEFSAALRTNIVTVLDYFGGFIHPYLQTTHSEKTGRKLVHSQTIQLVFSLKPSNFMR